MQSAGTSATRRMADPKEDARGPEPKEDGTRTENLRSMHVWMQWMPADENLRGMADQMAIAEFAKRCARSIFNMLADMMDVDAKHLK